MLQTCHGRCCAVHSGGQEQFCGEGRASPCSAPGHHQRNLLSPPRNLQYDTNALYVRSQIPSQVSSYKERL
jgi:hypothetical protein